MKGFLFWVSQNTGISCSEYNSSLLCASVEIKIGIKGRECKGWCTGKYFTKTVSKRKTTFQKVPIKEEPLGFFLCRCTKIPQRKNRASGCGAWRFCDPALQPPKRHPPFAHLLDEYWWVNGFCTIHTRGLKVFFFQSSFVADSSGIGIVIVPLLGRNIWILKNKIMDFKWTLNEQRMEIWFYMTQSEIVECIGTASH